MENDEINLLKKIISLSKNKNPKDPFIHEKLIEKVEKEYKIKFPKDYRNFLLKNNVSEINESVFLTDLKIIHVLQISEIYSISEVKSYLEEIKKNDDLTYLEKKMIIIGHSNIELNLTICYKGKNKGKVFLCVDGNFLIHYAALAKPEILKLLVENNINIEVENYNDLRPIDLITKDSYPENYQLLKSLMINYDDEIKKESFAETFRRLGL